MSSPSISSGRAQAASSSLVHLLRHHAREAPEVRAYLALDDGEREGPQRTWKGLESAASAWARRLAECAGAGQRALLLLPPGLDFIDAFLGCLAAGVVAVPAEPPRPRRSAQRLRAICADAAPYAVLASAALAKRREDLERDVPELARATWILSEEVDSGAEERWDGPVPGPEELAFLQYTSGSTAAPKGVMVSHGNLMANQAMIRETFASSASSVIVGWLPLYHDMGLIGNVLHPLFLGASCVLMAPMAFLQRPRRWLEAIGRFGATVSGGPNFAYELCLRKIPAARREGLDLSSWRVAFNGAEPVRSATLERFAAAFAGQGLRRETLLPCYGLAEATLLVSGTASSAPPRTACFDPDALADHRAVAVPEGTELVSCGAAARDLEVVVADPESRCRLRGSADGECPVGEIWVAGASVARGYWRQPELSRKIFAARLADDPDAGPFLRTGDLGFLEGGEVFVTGRLKDLIILRGRNLYPQDVELSTGQCHPALRPDAAAAFAFDADGEERLVVVQELEPRATRRLAGAAGAAEAGEVLEAVRAILAEDHEVQAWNIVLIRAGSLLRTTSGKVRRAATRAAWIAGELRVVSALRAAAPAANPSEAIPSEAIPSDAADGTEAGIALPTADSLRLLAPDRRRVALLSALTAVVAPLVRLPAARLDSRRALLHYGLDSLAAVELAHTCEARLGVAPRLEDLLVGASLDDLATSLAGQLNPEPKPDVGPQQDELDGQDTNTAPAADFDLSDGQRGLWFLRRLRPHSTAYTIAAAARLRQPIDPVAFGRALEGLARRHPMLRATFTSGTRHAAGITGERAGDGEPRQRIAEHAPPGFVRHRAEDLDDSALEQALRRAAEQPFDLENGPLLRADLWSRGAEDHVVLLCADHLIADFWSMAILARELGGLYATEAGSSGAATRPVREPQRSSQLPPPPRKLYTDWLTQASAAACDDALLAGWREQLAGVRPELDLPTDRPHPPVPSDAGAVISERLDIALGEALRSFAASQSSTLFHLLLAAWQALLHRVCDQDDLLVGTPTAGRPDAALRGVVGYFVNPLPLRSRRVAGQGFAEHLARSRRRTLAAFALERYPFARLVEHLDPARDPSRPPLIQAMLVLERSPRTSERGLAAFALGEPGGRIELGGLCLESMAFPETAVQFELVLRAGELEDGTLALSALYSTDLFDRTTIARHLGHLRRLLAAAITTPQGALEGLEILGAAERTQVLHQWNDDEVEPATQRIDLQVAEIAARRPEVVALVEGDVHVSWGRLLSAAEGLAADLRSYGVGRGDRVAIVAPASAELVVAAFAVLRCEAAYLPIDPITPARRVRAILADSGAIQLLCGSTVAAEVLREMPQARRIDVGELASRRSVGSAPSGRPGGEAGRWDPAYVIYTSGSTGRPKGVVIAHAGLSNLVAWHRRAYDLTARDRSALVAGPAFDASVWEMWPTLTTGGRLEIPAAELRSDPRALLRWLGARRLSVTFVPTPMAEELLRLTWPRSVVLRALLTGGDVLHRRPVPELGCQVINHYGPTEASVVSTAGTVEAVSSRTPRGPSHLAPPIGRPIDGVRTLVLDAHLGVLPIGVAGELAIGGVGLAAGYLGQSRLSAEKFVPDPHAGEPGARLYRSGDRARWRSDGTIDFLGRRDAQVQIRGVRIELAEIEAALGTLSGVAEAVVVARLEEGGASTLVAYLTAVDPNAPPAPTSLRSGLRELLPESMVPARLGVLDALPLTPNGKIDRRALAERQPPEALAHGSGAPRTPAEEKVAATWRELLGITEVDLGTSFFELGGHSLLAARLVERLDHVFGVRLPLRSIFEAPTVAGLVEQLETVRKEAVANARGLWAVPALTPAGVAGPAPLSFAQGRLWLLDRLAPGSAAYNLPFALELAGFLQIAALEAALGGVIRRHDVLRTRFVDRGGASEGVAQPKGEEAVQRELRQGEPVQVVEPSTPELLLPVVDLRRLAGTTARREARRRLEHEAQRPFDLGVGPLLRTALVRLADDSQVVFFCFHHILFDGWSTGIFLAELGAGYSASVQGRSAELAPLPVQYADYARWQRAWLDDATLETQIEAWRQELVGVRPLELPADRPRPARLDTRGGRLPWRLGEAESAALVRLGEGLGATPFMTLLAIWQTHLARLCGHREFAVGVPVANRRPAEVENLLGFFVNTLALRTDTAGDPSFSDLVERVRCRLVDALGRQEVPFERLVQALRPERDPSSTPIFQTLFADPGPGLTAPKLPGLAARRFDLDPRAAKLDLTLSLEPWSEVATDEAKAGGGGLEGWVEYAVALFDQVTVARWARAFERLAAGACRQPEQRLSALPWLDPAERSQLLGELAETKPATMSEASWRGSVVERLAARAVATPDTMAVVDDGAPGGVPRLWSYRELVRQSAGVAHRLRLAGVGLEERVAIHLEPGPEMVAAVLGTLAAGGAFVPLDPRDPPERRAAMRRAAAPRLEIDDAWLAAPTTENITTPLTGAESGSGADPQQLAYVLFTSGSTGQPKGVMVAHGELMAHLDWTVEQLVEADPARRFPRLPLVTRLCFDAVLIQLFGPLLAGGAVWIPPPESAVRPARLLRRLGEVGPCVLAWVPSMWEVLLEALENGAAPTPFGLRRFLLGGERLTRRLLERTWALLPEAEVVNLYGPTEATVNASWASLRPGAPVRLGGPVGSSRLVVANAHLRLQPLGVPGELTIGGAIVTRGYRELPARTARSFVPDPWSAAPGGRLYLTGDQVRRHLDGSLEFLGRFDDQVKVRGVRLELGEVETALRDLPGPREAAVVLATGSLVGVVAWPEGDNISEAKISEARGSKARDSKARVSEARVGDTGALAAALAQRLPAAAVPTAWLVVEALPRLPNGKLDRRALGQLAAEARPSEGEAGEQGAREAAGGGPVGPTEEVVAAVWEDLLGAELRTPLGREEDLFVRGGHSLLAARAAARLERIFGVEVPLMHLFETPSIHGQAQAVDAARAADMAPLPPLEPRTVETATGAASTARPAIATALALSHSQERLWFLDRLEPGSRVYHLPLALSLHGILDPIALERALAEILRRHASLRSRFPEEAGSPVLRLVPADASTAVGLLPRVDLERLVAADSATEASRLQRREIAPGEAAANFDLACGPLLRARLLRRAADAHILIVTVHHIVADGWSLGIFLRELGTLYGAFIAGCSSPLAELPLQASDWANWQRRALAGSLEPQLERWRQILDGSPALDLPLDHPRPDRPGRRAGRVPVIVPTTVASSLDHLARHRGATRFMWLVAGFQAVLARLCGQHDVAVGVPVANRRQPEVERVIGFFVNTLVLRGDLGGGPSFGELVERTRQRALSAWALQDVPFEKVVEAVRPARHLGHSPLFQVMLAFQGTPPAALEMPGIAVGRLPTPPAAPMFDLTLAFEAPSDGLRDGALCGALEYDADLFDSTTARRVAAAFERLLTGAATRPEQAIARAALLSPAERHRLLMEGDASPGPGLPLLVSLTLPEAFAETVSRRPDAIALRARRKSVEGLGEAPMADLGGLGVWTYATLAARVGELAVELRRAGVGPETRVGLALPRRAELVVAMLAVLAAGGAYVPLDPSYPRRRLRFMVQDADIGLLIADGDFLAELEDLRAGIGVLCPDLRRSTAAPGLAKVAAEINRPPHGSQLAWVIYTSGSTGRPKGTAITHANAAALLAWSRGAFPAAELEAVFAGTSINFDLSTFEILLTLARGGTVVLGEDALDLAGHPEASRTTLINTVPSAMAELLRQAAVPAAARAVCLAGEALPPELVRRLEGNALEGSAAAAQSLRVLNLYGPSEDTTYSTWARVDGGSTGGDSGSVPIGRPVTGCRARVLDAVGELLPPGVPGELHLGGSGVARGYLGRPALTAERFVPDPFTDASGERLYRTGDRVRSRADGALIFLGRQDHQVKVRGFRIELGEVESALGGHAAVREAAAGVRGEDDGRHLVAWIVLAEPEAGLAELREHLARTLPAPLVPRVLVPLDALPRTPNGKLDRGALPDPATRQRERVAPRSALEEIVAAVWAEALGVDVEEIGVDDDFFELGGHSLRATRVISALREQLGIELELRAFFEAPTVAGLSVAVVQALAEQLDDGELAAAMDEVGEG